MSAEASHVAEQTGTTLTMPERARTALGLIDVETKLKELVAKSSTITVITNADGREQVHASMMALKNQRITIEKAGKAARDDANKFADAVIERENLLVAIVTPEETRLKNLRDAWDTAREAERKAKIEAERNRVAAIQQDIETALGCIPTLALGCTAAQLESTIRDVVALEITAERFAEFAPIATAAKQSTLTKLREMLTKQSAIEAEQERLRLERIELERKTAEQQEANRLERERIAAEQAEAKRKADEEKAAAEVERQAKIDAELARMRAERAENARIAEEQRQQREREDAERAERQRLEDEQRQAEQRSRQAELQRQQAEIDAARAEFRRIEIEAAQAAESQRQLLERQQSELLTDFDQPVLSSLEVANANANAFVDRIEVLEREALAARSEEHGKPWAPTANDIIEVIADKYKVDFDQALVWCVNAFDEEAI